MQCQGCSSFAVTTCSKHISNLTSCPTSNDSNDSFRFSVKQAALRAGKIWSADPDSSPGLTWMGMYLRGMSPCKFDCALGRKQIFIVHILEASPIRRALKVVQDDCHNEKGSYWNIQHTALHYNRVTKPAA
jgi:hypothetical protein